MDKVEYDDGKVDWKGKPARNDKHGGRRAALLILATFAFDNFATFALSVNLVTYFNRVMHFDLADAANQHTNYLGASFILSIAMALLADTFLGRFKALLLSAFIEFVGLGLLAVQAHTRELKPPPCNIFSPFAQCEKVDGGKSAYLFIFLYLVALGTSGVKSVLPSHGADQFHEKEAERASSFFNWFLFSLCVGAFGSLSLLVWIQDNKGWDLGFLISTLAVLSGAIVLLSGLPLYKIHVIQGTANPILEIIQVYVAAIRNRKLSLPEDPTKLYELIKDNEAALEKNCSPHTAEFRFLDKAAIQESTSSQKPNPWKLCTVTQVENAKTLLGITPIFACTIIITLCQAQLQTFSIQQGATMDTKLGKSFRIPPASLPIIPIIVLLCLIPFYDRIVVPFLRRLTGIPTGITHLQRVGVGLVLTSISMAVAALVESKRKKVARSHFMLDAIPVLQPLPISVFWLSFQYFIFGVADMFTLVGLLEFFYSQAPKSLKSISSCFLWSSMALGYFLSSVLVNIVNSATKNITSSRGWLAGNNLNRNHLNLFFWLLTIICLVNLVMYLFVSKSYKYRPESQPKLQHQNIKE